MMPADNRVLVIGSSNADIVLNVPRNPFKGESLLVDKRTSGLGGKGSNRAVALSRLGASVQLCCKIGRDAYGESILQAYEHENLSAELILFDDEIGTGTAYVLLDEDGNNTILSYLGANDTFNRQDIDKVASVMPQFNYLSMELEFSLAAVEEFLFHARGLDICSIVDAGPVRDISLEIFKDVYILSPNENEAAQLTGIEIRSLADAKQACRKLYESGCRNVVLKMGGNGALLYDGHEFTPMPAYRNAGPLADTTAAGDCFMAALTYALTGKMNLKQAIQYANVAAALSVTRRGAIPSLPAQEEVAHMYAKAQREGYIQ